MGLFDSVIDNVKSDLELKASRGISSGISGSVSKAIGGSGGGAKKCPQCKKPLPENAVKFCPGCGAKLVLTCEKCSIDYPAGTKFCTQCGQALE